MSGRSDPFRLTVFVGFCFADDGEALAATKEAARDFAMAPELHRMIWPANNQWRKPSTEHAMAEGLAIGTGEEIAAFINALADSGADALIVEPMGNPVVQLARFAEEALPLVSR